MATIFTSIHSDSDLPKLYKWADLHKSHQLIVVDGYGMDDIACENLLDMDINVLTYFGKRSQVASLEAVVNHMSNFESLLYFCDIRYQIKSIGTPNKLVVSAPHSDTINLDNMVRAGICSIDNMVLFQKEIQEKIGKPLDGHIICATPDKWSYLLSYYKCLIAANVIENRSDTLNIVINLFAVYFGQICSPYRELQYKIIDN